MRLCIPYKNLIIPSTTKHIQSDYIDSEYYNGLFLRSLELQNPLDNTMYEIIPGDDIHPNLYHIITKTPNTHLAPFLNQLSQKSSHVLLIDNNYPPLTTHTLQHAQNLDNIQVVTQATTQIIQGTPHNPQSSEVYKHKVSNQVYIYQLK